MYKNSSVRSFSNSTQFTFTTPLKAPATAQTLLNMLRLPRLVLYELRLPKVWLALGQGETPLLSSGESEIHQTHTKHQAQKSTQT